MEIECWPWNMDAPNKDCIPWPPLYPGITMWSPSGNTVHTPILQQLLGSSSKRQLVNVCLLPPSFFLLFGNMHTTLAHQEGRSWKETRPSLKNQCKKEKKLKLLCFFINCSQIINEKTLELRIHKRGKLREKRGPKYTPLPLSRSPLNANCCLRQTLTMK